MFKRAWFMAHLYARIEEILGKESPNNDLEYFMNWDYPAWNDADITVALGEGLFTHHEIGEHAEGDFSVIRAVRALGPRASQRASQCRQPAVQSGRQSAS